MDHQTHRAFNLTALSQSLSKSKFRALTPFGVWLGLGALSGAPTATAASAQSITVSNSQANKQPGTARQTQVQDKQLRFSDATDSGGLSGIYTEGNSHCGGVAWVDYNNDYWPDLFITNGPGWPHRLFRNNGDGSFEDMTAGIAKSDLSLPEAGVKYADFDNDGDADLLVTVDHTYAASMGPNIPTGGPNLYYVNQGDGTFVEQAAGTGLLDPQGRRNICASLADFDRDGWIDAYIANWQMNDDQSQNFDRLLRNTGNHQFVDVTAQMGVNSYGRDTLTCLWFDAQMDGWPDLYVGVAGSVHSATQNTHDVFYHNQAGASFSDVTGDPNVIGNDAQAAMGMDIGDIDNDGDWDLYITDIQSYPVTPLGNPLYLGDGQGGFQDNIADQAKVQAHNSWPCNFADFNLDGWTDLWVGCQGFFCPDWLYINNRDGTFRLALDTSLYGNSLRGGSIADYDGDGDVDFFFWNYRQNSKLIRNDSDKLGHWMEFKLLATQSNRSAIGALVRVTANGQTQMRRVSGGDSAHSQMDSVLHFGVERNSNGPNTADVSVEWPSGVQQNFRQLDLDQLHFINETTGVLAEDLTSQSAVWNPSVNTMKVEVKSNFGGRTRLQVQGLGVLKYEASSVSHVAFFPASSAPSNVTVASESGGVWTIPVQ